MRVYDLGTENKGTEKITADQLTTNQNQETCKEFDLNIEKILENWEIYHAIREIIANALDEQILTETKEIEIKQTSDGWWHIRDYGRGLNYHHLTQNENEEKLNSDKLIGRFGVGLKDALATLYRHRITVKIKSKYGIITLKTTPKVGFEDIITLHAEIAPTDDENIVGTDFCLYGCTKEDIEKAKSLFLNFTEEEILEKTKYGDVISKNGQNSNIYINGVKVAEESNFLFSYNVTSLNTNIKKALNRERINVGRTAYTGRIKDILTACSSKNVISKLMEDMRGLGSGLKHDELSWNEISLFASKKMSELDRSVSYITAEQAQNNPALIDSMRRDGLNLVIVPENLIQKMEEYNIGTQDENVLRTAFQYQKEQQRRFVPNVISINLLSETERQVYDQTGKILHLIGGRPSNVKNIEIVDKIYESEFYDETVGLWQASEGRILIKRNQLKKLDVYAGTLLHECIHAISGMNDVSRDFERELTNVIGLMASLILSV